MIMCLFYSILPVKNTFMYLAIMCQPVEDGSYKAGQIIIATYKCNDIIIYVYNTINIYHMCIILLSILLYTNTQIYTKHVPVNSTILFICSEHHADTIQQGGSRMLQFSFSGYMH